MTNYESEGSVEKTLIRTKEASEIVFKGIEPIAIVLADNFLLGLYFISLNHPKLSRIFGSAYYFARLKRDEKLKKY